MAQAKTTSEYIKAFPKDTREKLQAIRQTIKKAAPGAVEAISYGIPVFRLKDTYLIYFAGYKNHVSVYPIPPASAALKKQIEPYVFSKGTLRFALDKPLPLGLIRKVAQAHVKRVRAKG
jgi:uncharacterized protein YdhG (YjbR/CyaY superfamily)